MRNEKVIKVLNQVFRNKFTNLALSSGGSWRVEKGEEEGAGLSRAVGGAGFVPSADGSSKFSWFWGRTG